MKKLLFQKIHIYLQPWGAAMNHKSDNLVKIKDLAEKLSKKVHMDFEIKRMDPLFSTQKEYDEFTTRHNMHNVKTEDISTYEGKCFLGIDAGSTTTKVALVSESGSLLYSFYRNNNGSPLQTAIDSVKEIYDLLPDNADVCIFMFYRLWRSFN